LITERHTSLVELLKKLAALPKESRDLIARLAERYTAEAHICDRKGNAERIVDESGSQLITRIAPTCSVCRKPQVFSHADQE